MQIRGKGIYHRPAAEQRDFREAFSCDRGCGGNNARVFTLGQYDALRAHTRARLQFLNQCPHPLKLSQVCATRYFSMTIINRAKCGLVPGGLHVQNVALLDFHLEPRLFVRLFDAAQVPQRLRQEGMIGKGLRRHLHRLT